MVLVIGIGGARVIDGTFAIEDLEAFVLYLGMLYQPWWMLADDSEAIERCIASLARIQEALEIRPSVAEPAQSVGLNRARGELRFEKVSFVYRHDASAMSTRAADHPPEGLEADPVATADRHDDGKLDVLHDIDLSVAPGETLALVGATGVGKSTLVNLIARFHDPREDCILLDGHDLTTLSLADLRRNLAVVQQDVFLFYASITENIRFARPDASDNDVIAAATVAHAHDFVSALPEDYATLVGERGVILSGGQKQRLSIARAVLKTRRC